MVVSSKLVLPEPGERLAGDRHNLTPPALSAKKGI